MLGWQEAVLIGRKRRVIIQYACHIVVAEDVPYLYILVEENWLCLTHLTKPVIRGSELFSLGLCLHNPSSFTFYDLQLDWWYIPHACEQICYSNVEYCQGS